MVIYLLLYYCSKSVQISHSIRTANSTKEMNMSLRQSTLVLVATSCQRVHALCVESNPDVSYTHSGGLSLISIIIGSVS